MGEFSEYMNNIINNADFAKMPELQAITEAWKHYNDNETRFNELF